MIDPIPLQLVDGIVQQFNAGEALVGVFVLSILGVLPLKSMKAFSLNLLVFGLLFALIPSAMAPIGYKLFGFALLVIAPLLYAMSSR